MTMLAEDYDFVIRGDPDRDTIDLAVLDTGTGGVHAHLADAADGAGYRRMLGWASNHAPGRGIWALEGTGSFAAGLVVSLLEAGEIGALKRARGAKNDRIDAIRAARQALARDEQGAPRSGGLREALRMIFACREGVLVSRTKAINELKSLIVVAPEQLRGQLRGHSLAVQLARIEQLQIVPAAPVQQRLSVFSLQSIAARVRFPSEQLAELDPQLLELIKQHPAGPALLAEAGVGPVVAAQLLISWSHHGRVRNEAAFAFPGRCRAVENQQRPTLAASPQPWRRPRVEPGTAHGRHHPDEMPSGDPHLRDPPQRRRQDSPRHPTLCQTSAGPTPLPKDRDRSPAERGTHHRLTNIGASNGLLHQYFPKGTDLTIHTPQRLLEVATELNARPRKTLGGITPAEALQRLLSDPETPIVATTA